MLSLILKFRKKIFYLIVLCGLFFIIFRSHFLGVGQNQIVILPMPTGPFSVGTKSIYVKGFTTKSKLSTNEKCLILQAYYPSDGNLLKPTYYQPETLQNGVLESVEIKSFANLNASLKSGIKNIPVIIFIPGFGNKRQDYSILCEEIASFGGLVLSVDEPQISSFIRYNDYKVEKMNLLTGYKVFTNREFRYKYFDLCLEECIKDIHSILNNIASLNKATFNSQLDTENIVLIGHSFGGNVAHTLGFTDQRIKAVIDIDSKITDKPILGRIGPPENKNSTPSFFIRAMMQYQENVPTTFFFQDVWCPFVQHSAFTDAAYLTKRIPALKNKHIFHLLLNWIFNRPFIWGVDCDVGSQDIDFWFLRFRKKIINKLKEWNILKED